LCRLIRLLSTWCRAAAFLLASGVSKLDCFYNPSARTAQKTASLLSRRRVYRPLHRCLTVARVFTQLFHSNGCTRHISYRARSSVVECNGCFSGSTVPAFRKYASILSSYLCLGLPSSLFPSDSATETPSAFIFSATYPAHLILHDFIIIIIFSEEYKL
jgi:hypothetical protein